MDNDRVRAANYVATETAIDAILADDDRYPGGAAFVGEDHPAFDAIVARHVHAGEPFVVVAPDGSETLYTPTHA